VVLPEERIDLENHYAFIENGGYFPLIINDKENMYIFCRTNAGHLGKNGSITILRSTDGTRWDKKSIVSKYNTDIRNPSVYIFPDGEILLSTYK
jgi:hypothetical protein